MMIRDLEKRDYESIKRLVMQVHKLHLSNRPDIYNDIDPLPLEYFEFLLQDEKTIALVYEMEQQTVGFCVVTLREPSKNPLMKARNVAFMEDLCVDLNFRKAGIGTALLEKAKELSKQRCADILELNVWSFNETAVQFYEKAGMKPKSMIMEQKL